MIGPDGATSLLVQSFAVNIETRLAILAQTNGPVLTPEGFPADVTPKFVAAAQRGFDAVGIDEWPFVLVVPQGDPQTVRSDILDDGTKIYRVTYDLRVFGWVRGEGYDMTSSMQRRLALACKEVMFSYQQLTKDAAIDETSIVGRYSDVAPDPSIGGTVGAFWYAVKMNVEEQLVPVRAGTLPGPDGNAVSTDTTSLKYAEPQF